MSKTRPAHWIKEARKLLLGAMRHAFECIELGSEQLATADFIEESDDGECDDLREQAAELFRLAGMWMAGAEEIASSDPTLQRLHAQTVAQYERKYGRQSSSPTNTESDDMRGMERGEKMMWEGIREGMESHRRNNWASQGEK